MNHRYTISIWILLLVLSMISIPLANAQRPQHSSRLWAANVIVPQAGSFSAGSRGAVKISGIQAGTVITEQVAETTLEISLTNTSSVRQESSCSFPYRTGLSCAHLFSKVLASNQKQRFCLNRSPPESTTAWSQKSEILRCLNLLDTACCVPAYSGGCQRRTKDPPDL